MSKAPATHRRIRLTMDAYAGLAMIVLALLGAILAGDLRLGTISQMGAGFLPFAFIITLAVLGAVICIRGAIRGGPKVDRYALRPLLLIPLSVLMFGILVERTGLLVASGVTVVFAGLATSETRVSEVILLAIFLPVIVAAIFVGALNLPISTFPW